MNGQTHLDTRSVRRILLLVVLGCLLSGSFASAVFQSGPVNTVSTPV